MDLYQQNILDYYKNPRRRGELDASTHRSAVANPSCGDSVQIFLQVVDGTVRDAKWIGEGCVLSQASADMLTDFIIGKKFEDVLKVDSQVLIKLLGVELSPNRMKCALLPLEATRGIKSGIS